MVVSRLNASTVVPVGATAFAALVLYRYGTTAALALALVPVLLIAVAAILDRGLQLLFALVFVIPLSGISALNDPLPFGGANIHVQDLLVILLLGALLFGRLIGRLGGIALADVPRTPVTGWAIVPFGLFVVIALLRGHYAFGASVVGQPLRLIAYAVAVIGLTGLDAKRLHRLLRLVFYSGTVVETLWGLYYLGTGGSQSHSVDLSTGGVRPLAITEGLYCAGALFLALMTIRNSPNRGKNALDFVIAAMAVFVIILGFGRGVFAAVALVLLILFLTSRDLRRAVLRLVPLAVPFVCLGAIVLVQLSPNLISSFVSRVGSSPTADANVIWREKANEAILAQFRQEPLFGVGFGATSSFYIDVKSSNGYFVPVRQDIGQDPHNGYLFLAAGGGVLTLVSFLLLLGVFTVDAVRRYRGAVDDTERTIVAWAGAMLFCFLFESGSGTELSSSTEVFAIWALLVTPGVVPLRRPVRVPGPRFGPVKRRPALLPVELR
jgi:O-antigen ligase